MKILKSWLQDHIVETLPTAEAIADALTLKSSEVEGVEKMSGKNDANDAVFDIKVLPDRAHYMLSHRGVAYDLCAILNLTMKPESTALAGLAAAGTTAGPSVNIESLLCNRYSALSISGITNTPSPEWLKARLEAIGARSINSIVDATNYAMFDTGQPLHAFDAEKVVGGITVRFAKDGETLETLDGKLLKLKSTHLVVADEVGPLALAGVKGGKRAEVTLSTQNIILEAANFNPASVRKTSFEVGIRNDSSKRFENEITPDLTSHGVSVFMNIIKKVSPSCTAEGITDIYTAVAKPWTIEVPRSLIESILNFKISKERVTEILKKLQCDVVAGDLIYKVSPQLTRLDLIIPEDIVDEVGRIEGLDKIQSILPQLKTNHVFAPEFLLTEKIKDFFASRGFSEVQTRSFAPKGDIEVAHPMASDKAFLRTSLLKGVSDSMNLSILQAPLLGLDKIQIFEIGKAFPKSGEQLDLCFGISYVKKIKNKVEVTKKEIEGLISELEAKLGTKLNSSINASGYGYIQNLEKAATVLAKNLTMNELMMKAGSRTQFVPYSNEPFIVRDIALFVPAETSTDEVQQIIAAAAIAAATVASPTAQENLLVKGPDLFDQFEKDSKKSLGFRMIFQAAHRTLTDVETNAFMEKIYAAVALKNWQVR